MTRFNQTTLSPSNTTVDIGTGLIWDEVYASLEASGCNCNVVGGRVSGVGVAGFSLGGGACDTEAQYNYLHNFLYFYIIQVIRGSLLNLG